MKTNLKRFMEWGLIALIWTGLFGVPGAWAVNNDLNFDGTDDYVSVADDLSLDISEGTIEAWVEFDLCSKKELPVDAFIDCTEKEILFIESDVQDFHLLIESIPRTVEIVLMDAGQNGLDQMAEILFYRRNLDAIHIVSHGNVGSLHLGSVSLNMKNITEYKDRLTTLGRALSQTGDILLYGCNVAALGKGNDFIRLFNKTTGRDVAASMDLTGSLASGGNWVLEAHAGRVETETLFNSNLIYQWVLETIDITSEALGSASGGFKAIGSTDFSISDTGSNTYGGGDAYYSNDGNLENFSFIIKTSGDPFTLDKFYIREFADDGLGVMGALTVVLKNSSGTTLMTKTGNDLTDSFSTTPFDILSLSDFSGVTGQTGVSQIDITFDNGDCTPNCYVSDFGVTSFDVTTGSSTIAYYYRTDADGGNWNVPSGDYTWTRCLTEGGSYENTYEAPTTSNSVSVTIVNGATVNVNTSTSIDQTTVASGGTLAVANGQTLTIADGEGTDLTVTGTLTNSGTITCNSDSSVLYNGGDQTVLPLDYHELSFVGSTSGSTKTFADGTTKVGTEISLTDTITFTGSSADNVTVQVDTPGTSTFRVFHINASGKEVTINNMTIKGGKLTTADGGAVYVQAGTLNLDSVTVSDSIAQTGGGIYFNASTIGTITNSTLCNNKSTENDGSGASGGGGIMAIGNLNMTSSTISGNQAVRGGGLFLITGTFELINCTIYGNSHYDSNDAYGMGVYLKSCTASFINMTISKNISNYRPGGILIHLSTLDIKNSIIAYNTGASEDDVRYVSTTLNDNGYNVVGINNNAGVWDGTGTWLDTDGDGTFTQNITGATGTLNLAANLADKGGPTQTLALISSASIAVGNGNTAETTDQRGASRKSPPTIGAYEYIADFRTDTESGTSWGTPANWEIFEGVLPWEGASEYPDDDNYTSIDVRRSMNVGENVSIDRTTVQAAATLTIDADKTLTVTNCDGTDLTVQGDLINSGTLICEAYSTVFFSGAETSTLSGAGDWNFKTLTLNKDVSDDLLDINTGSDLTVATALTVTQGTVDLGDWEHNLKIGGTMDIGPNGRWSKHGDMTNFIQFYGNTCTLGDTSSNRPQNLGYIRVEDLP